MEVKDEKLEKQIQKQIGCMAGFFHIFDRHPYSVKRLPSSISTVSIHSIISYHTFTLILHPRFNLYFYRNRKHQHLNQKERNLHGNSPEKLQDYRWIAELL